MQDPDFCTISKSKFKRFSLYAMAGRPLRPGALSQLFSSFMKSFRTAKRNRIVVGKDRFGNLYYEESDPRRSSSRLGKALLEFYLGCTFLDQIILVLQSNPLLLLIDHVFRVIFDFSAWLFDDENS